MATNYGTLLESVVSGENKNPAAPVADPVLIDKQEVTKQSNVDTYAALMTPLAETGAGMAALQQLMANPEGGQEQRAAAAQAINPGLKASVGVHGELSFSSAAGSDINYQKPEPNADYTKPIATKVVAGQSPEFSKNFDTAYRTIQAESDPLKVANLHAELAANAGAYVASKQASIKDRLNRSLGVSQLEKQIATDRSLDEQYWQSRGMPYQGPSEESIANLQLYNNATASVDQQAAKELAADPDFVALNAKLQAMDTLVGQKLQIAGGASQDQMKAAQANKVIVPLRVENAAKAYGIDPKDPESRNLIAIKLFDNDPQALKAEQIGGLPQADQFTIAMAGGVEGSLATNALNSLYGNPEYVSKIVTKAKSLPDTVLSPEMQSAVFGPAGKAGLSPTQQAALQPRIDRLKVELVLKDLQKERSDKFSASIGSTGQSDGWAVPTDPMLAEVPQIIKDKQANGNLVTVDTIAASLDFKGADRAVKMQKYAEWVYAHATKEPLNNALGLPPGYTDIDGIRNRASATAVYHSTNPAVASSFLAARIGVSFGNQVGKYSVEPALAEVGKALSGKTRSGSN